MREFIKSIITGEDNKIFYLLLRPVMIFLSFIYLAAISIIALLYRINILKAKKASRAKIISIGNITWGGTGKTSIVMTISNYLQSKGKQTAILMRGYGEDEDKMLKEKLNDILVLSGKNRYRNMADTQKAQPIDAFVLDDGFQHRRLKRDLDIVVINATNPFGNKRLLPAGILREPIKSLKRAHIIIINKVNLTDKNGIDSIKAEVLKFAPNADIFEAEYMPVLLTEAGTYRQLRIDYIKNKKICVTASVGDNQSFFKMLSQAGALSAAKFSFIDHHKYTEGDIQKIFTVAKTSGCSTVITTPKDWMRLKMYFDKDEYAKLEVLLLNSIIKIKDEEKFFERIYSLFNS